MIDYDSHKWRINLLDIKGSMLREIIARVMVCVLWSAGVVACHRYAYHVGIPSTVHGLIGVALGMLLVFRTNASYDRFWEGRKLWGGIVNETRNLARSGWVFLHEDEPGLYRRLSRWTAAWPFAVMNQLRGRRGLGPLADELPDDEVQSVLSAQHPPLAITLRLSEVFLEARRRDRYSDFVQLSLDQNVQQLVDYMGACERIRNTPLPFAYVVHLRRALVIYCFSLPFALVESFGWYAVLAVFLVAYIFFGVEEIGVQIEDPFGIDDNDLPLDAICENIRRNIVGLGEQNPVAALSLEPPPRAGAPNARR
ncbi:MAG: hypothetical protein HY909_06860 [Deltaproteobacteria bacterium]|nr:hypothetical protein [Deltaproteobacteria bacterium]